ncbi:polyketide synthase [Mesobacterium sp. TK19101]|uniref:Polyketide synthase n=1 Tax=Mesobacterium hydrothermale TaxID=3111907 RepID=A0ABU6HHB1_9RHOB|nr:polyketide synthase [Mesobacterium sp. TK19101]MEC3861802.1 polyketide synthase [Mesobacterium sp. TK19101]
MMMLVVALATTGFSHRFTASSDQQAQRYAASFGLDASAICGGGSEGTADHGCDACRLHAAMALSDPAIVTTALVLSLTPVAWADARPARAATSHDATPPVRGPPQV